MKRKSYALYRMVIFPTTLIIPNPFFKVAAFLKSIISKTVLLRHIISIEHYRKLYLTYGMVLRLVTLTDLWPRHAGLSASAELLIMSMTLCLLLTKLNAIKWHCVFFTFITRYAPLLCSTHFDFNNWCLSLNLIVTCLQQMAWKKAGILESCGKDLEIYMSYILHLVIKVLTLVGWHSGRAYKKGLV